MNDGQEYLDEARAHTAEFEQSRDPASLSEAFLELENAGAVAIGNGVPVTFRREVLVQWLGLLRLLDESIDPDFDPDDMPGLTVDPPRSADGVAHRPGVAPARIKDPDARARYEAAIEANQEKARYYAAQTDLRRLDERMTSRIEAFIKRAYTDSPEDQTELRTALDAVLGGSERATHLGRLIRAG